MKKKRHPFFFQSLASFCLFSCLLIAFYEDTFDKQWMHRIMSQQFPFLAFKQTYESVFGSAVPFLLQDDGKYTDVVQVAEESPFLTGTIVEKTTQGWWVQVANQAVIQNPANGFILFCGNQNQYGKTVIIQLENNREMWIGHIDKCDVPMYSFIQKGEYIGKSKDNLLFVALKHEGQWESPEKVFFLE
ncbi:M23 family metallopeptidase [Massilibacterium senegalense]|uniref:M23 family metallopeptidase n=1 Tax=Massilibacterium senegalense TaxID=1632858 RepID=UPI0011C99BDB|nr:M23 family metallopeptidase [Massilibacterium senegalense]